MYDRGQCFGSTALYVLDGKGLLQGVLHFKVLYDQVSDDKWAEFLNEVLNCSMSLSTCLELGSKDDELIGTGSVKHVFSPQFLRTTTCEGVTIAMVLGFGQRVDISGQVSTPDFWE